MSESEQEFARPLLTADEVLRLPFDGARLLLGPRHGAYGQENDVLLDLSFSDRAGLPPLTARANSTPSFRGGRRRSRSGRPSPDCASGAAASSSDFGQAPAMSSPSPGERGEEPAPDLDLLSGPFSSLLLPADEELPVLDDAAKSPERSP